MTEGVIWEDPPNDQVNGPRNRFMWREQLTLLQANPGRWGIITTKDSAVKARAMASNLGRRIIKRPDGEWEFTWRRRGDGEFAVYGRYLGEEP